MAHGTGKVDYVAGFRRGDVDAEDGAVRHAVEADDVSIQIADGNAHLRADSDGEPDQGARDHGCVHGVRDDAGDLGGGEAADSVGRRDQVALRRLTGTVHGSLGVVRGVECAGDGAGRRGRLIDEGERDAVDDHFARRRKGCYVIKDTVEIDLRGGEGSVFGGEWIDSGDSDASDHDAVLENRDAAGIHGCRVAVRHVGFAGGDAEAGQRAVDPAGRGNGGGEAG